MSGPIWIPSVAEHKHVIYGEIVFCDDDLAEILAWNTIPTFYVRLLREKKLIEVEPWRIKKIEKCPSS